ncbi:hypothetical protein XELAEV_18027744mg [Xenopus laevis]|uniref:Uncharacterized protein n=1 Tax=Xenopus laevis TaxID=8355 RepID=A0A974CWX0_XENLA|nr:hypothetical protein XELAEV_18027744mg [Xenopus laevis]
MSAAAGAPSPLPQVLLFSANKTTVRLYFPFSSSAHKIRLLGQIRFWRNGFISSLLPGSCRGLSACSRGSFPLEWITFPQTLQPRRDFISDIDISHSHIYLSIVKTQQMPCITLPNPNKTYISHTPATPA